MVVGSTLRESHLTLRPQKGPTSTGMPLAKYAELNTNCFVCMMDHLNLLLNITEIAVLSLLLRGRTLAPPAMCTLLKPEDKLCQSGSIISLPYLIDEVMQRIAKAVVAIEIKSACLELKGYLTSNKC